MFELAHTWALILIPLPLLVWFLLPETKVKVMDALEVPFYDAMKQLIQKQQKFALARPSLILPSLMWLFLVLALAGPRWVGEPLPLKREGYNIMMALDLSGSMEVTDMVLHGRPVSRLMVVKRAAEQFVEDRKGDHIGLILFGTQAYLQTPLTYDRQSILARIEDATVGLAGKTTSIGDAVGLAVKRLEAVPKQGRVIILLTDGANNSGVLAPLKAAEIAKADDIKIYTIGLGAESDPNALTPDNFLDANVSADLDEETLKEMAKMTGGQYFRATDPDSLGAIYKTINQLERIKQEQASIRPQKEYYPWLIAIALLLGDFWLAIQSGLMRKLERQEEAR
ncbi:VWA domain-containing protein [Legionella sp. km772]|uniref:VWA domain-containing protein n=1 Tax=Legionella sp. km772 TaxID=2498111 RepID=UPI000F8EF734|nr:VWA domain-containing protein [Legionella sp. km772]RUR13836.1 VWA domain-containing protein [Legionella sp. km772]